MLWWTRRQLKSEIWWKRRDAARKLGESRNPKAVEPLIAALTGPSSSEATQALVRIGEVAIKPLMTALQDSSRFMREQVAKALGEIGDARAVEPLIAALQDSDWSMRRRAAEALGKIGDAQAVEPLIARLQDSNSHMRYQVASALTPLGYEPTDENQQAIVFVARQEWDNAIELGPVAVEPLIIALKGEDFTGKNKVAKALGRTGDARAVQPLIAALKDSSLFVRREAAEALGKIGDAQGVAPLIAAFQDSDLNVQEKAAEALGQIGEAAAEPLIAKLTSSCSSQATDALVKAGKTAVGRLIGALQDSNWEVQMRAAKALGGIGDMRAVESLIAALQDSNNALRSEAVAALGKIGDVRAIEPLAICLREAPTSLGNEVVCSLEALGWSPTTNRDRDLVASAKAYGAEIERRVNERMRKTPTRTDSNHWKCPKCAAILVKPMSAALRSAISDRIEGNSTCVPCGAVFPASDVYGGRYDV